MPAVPPALPAVPAWGPEEELRAEREAIGFFITGHPLDRYEQDLRRFTNVTIGTLRTRGAGPGPLACFALFEAPRPPLPIAGEGSLGPLSPEVDRGEHARGVAAIREALAAGAAYQVNLTCRLRGRFEGDTLIVETTNFTDKVPYRGSSDRLREKSSR